MSFINLASEAVNILHQRGICHQTNAPIELVASDILDHYRTYALLEKLLHTPTKLASEQLAFQIEPQTSQMLIEMYKKPIYCLYSLHTFIFLFNTYIF